MARSRFWSQHIKSIFVPDHFWTWSWPKCAYGCGGKHMSKWKSTKRTTFGALLEVEMAKKRTPFWREARYEVKMLKAPRCRKSACCCGTKHMSKLKVLKTDSLGQLWMRFCVEGAMDCASCQNCILLHHGGRALTQAAPIAQTRFPHRQWEPLCARKHKFCAVSNIQSPNITLTQQDHCDLQSVLLCKLQCNCINHDCKHKPEAAIIQRSAHLNCTLQWRTRPKASRTRRTDQLPISFLKMACIHRDWLYSSLLWNRWVMYISRIANNHSHPNFESFGFKAAEHPQLLSRQNC